MNNPTPGRKDRRPLLFAFHLIMILLFMWTGDTLLKMTVTSGPAWWPMAAGFGGAAVYALLWIVSRMLFGILRGR